MSPGHRSLVNEGLHPRRPQGCFLRAGPSGQINVPRAGRLERGGSGFGLAVIGLVGAAQAGERGARGLEGGGEREGAVLPPTASMPPASKKFLAKLARALKSAGLPRVARNTFGRAPVWAKILSDASRSCSNGSARRMRGSAAAVTAASSFGCAAGATSRTAGKASLMSGNSLVPVRMSVRRATARSRSARTAAAWR